LKSIFIVRCARPGNGGYRENTRWVVSLNITGRRQKVEGRSKPNLRRERLPVRRIQTRQAGLAVQKPEALFSTSLQLLPSSFYLLPILNR